MLGLNFITQMWVNHPYLMALLTNLDVIVKFGFLLVAVYLVVRKLIKDGVITIKWNKDSNEQSTIK